MSGFQHREGSGSLWPNKDKGDNAKAPNSKGEIMLNGVVFEIAGWTREAKNGQKFISLSGKPKGERQERREAPRQEPQRVAGAGHVDDEVPFAACWQ